MSGIELQLRKHLGKYKWFRRLTRSRFGWYWRKDPLKEARRRMGHPERYHGEERS